MQLTYNRFIGSSRMGGASQRSDDAQHRWKAGGAVFDQTFAKSAGNERLMIASTHHEAHRPPASLLKRDSSAVQPSSSGPLSPDPRLRTY